MIHFLKNLIHSGPKKDEKNDFSEFFINADSQEKTKLIRQVLKEATEEQRILIQKYKAETKTT